MDATVLVLSVERDGEFANTMQLWDVQCEEADANRVRWDLGLHRLVTFPQLSLGHDLKQEGRERTPRLRTFGLPAGPRLELGPGVGFGRIFPGAGHGPALNFGCKFPVRCRVTGTQRIAGRDCLLVEVAYPGELPEGVDHTGLYEGGPPPVFKLEAFAQRHWVDTATGRLVQVSHQSSLRAEDGGQHWTTQRELQLALVEERRLEGQELESHLDQAARLCSIERHARGGPQYNGAEDADMGLGKLADFTARYPDSPYVLAVRDLEERLRNQRQFALDHPDTDRSSPLLGQPAPPFLGRAADGTLIGLDDLRGHPAVLIFLNLAFPLAQEAGPALKALHEKWQPRGVEIVGTGHGDLAAYAARNGLTFPFFALHSIHPPNDPNDREARELWERAKSLKSVDHAYNLYCSVGVVGIDREGVIRHYRWGLYPEELGGVLEELTAE
jgi:peroxiredoxin